MSYDTTVHDALEPPLHRVAEARISGRFPAVRWFIQRRVIALATIAAISLSTLGGVTWTVARLSGPPHPAIIDDAEASPLGLSQSPADLTPQLHGGP